MASGKMKEQTDLKKDTVDIWRVDLDINGNQLHDLQKLLSQDEIARAERLKSEELKKRFIAARGFLRKILSSYTGQDPKDIMFRYNEDGKPELINNQIQFNLSHSKDIALYAVALERAVGIDIETIDPHADHMRLAKEYFSEQEFRDIAALPPDQQKKAFYRAWTRKEALAKAKGSSVLKFLDKNDKSHDGSGWSIAELEYAGDSYISTVAVRGEDIDIRYVPISSSTQDENNQVFSLH
jgi:4'-phosphopantetheinyl transferase